MTVQLTLHRHRLSLKAESCHRPAAIPVLSEINPLALPDFAYYSVTGY